MIVYGRNPLREALCGRRAKSIREIWATRAAAGEPWLEGADVHVCSAEEIERRCGSSSHQGVCGDAGPYPYVDAGELLAEHDPLIVVLDQVQDPQNLGSICRTAECAGATGVVIADRRSAEVTPAVCKASAGAVEHIRIARVRNIADLLLTARDAGCWSYGASAPASSAPASSGADAHTDAVSHTQPDPSGDSAADFRTVPYTQPDYSGGVLLVLGSEGVGLRRRVASACDQIISLPIRGHVESLGVAAAAAALLYGILQARERGLDKTP